MIIILVLGVHLLFITLYAWMILTGRSRLNMRHLLLALCFPFVGEICLLAAEIGGIPANPVYRSSLKKKERMTRPASGWTCPENWKEIVLGDESAARAFLMKAIDSEDECLPEILQTGLLSSSSEVSHIAASKLMNLHRRHEDAIARAAAESGKNPDNMPLLAAYIDAIHAYRVSGLPDRFSCDTLAAEERRLLERYLRTMPNDTYYAGLMQLLSGTGGEAK